MLVDLLREVGEACEIDLGQHLARWDERIPFTVKREETESPVLEYPHLADPQATVNLELVYRAPRCDDLEREIGDLLVLAPRVALVRFEAPLLLFLAEGRRSVPEERNVPLGSRRRAICFLLTS